jgi:NADH dehydrogenase [ubiquinone] 1 alpha subcomplex assembly factor 1
MDMKRTLSVTCLTMVALSMATIAGSADKTSKPGAWRGQSVTEFDAAENKKMGWRITDDGVMGGLSKGKVEFTKAGTMKFSGELSLKNNGGFSTVRTDDVKIDLGNAEGLLLLVKGDGRTYEARLASDARYRSMEVSFSGKFKTTKDKWTLVKIPFSDFKGSWRGTDLKDKVLDPSNIQRVGIILADKKEGPFEVEIDWIRTYGKGKGNVTANISKPESSEGESYPGGIIETAVADGRFTTLKAALDAAKLTTFFKWDNKLTVFAPTDEAFAKLPKEVLSDLLKPENKDKLVAILSYHVVAGANGLGDALKAFSHLHSGGA